MENKTMTVYYGIDRLPYKDKERKVHYPNISKDLGGNLFIGENNTTIIKFFVGRIGANGYTWIANIKRPDGKLAFRVLDNGVATEDDYYVSLDISSLYTDQKGEVFIGLSGYRGDIIIDEEDDEYIIHGTPDITATGSVKILVNYTPSVLPKGEVITPTEAQQIIAILQNKANKSEIIFVVNSINDTLVFDNGQLVFAKNTGTLYKFDNTETYPDNFVEQEVNLKNQYLALDGTNEMKGNLVPYTTETYDIGKHNKKWEHIWANQLSISSIYTNGSEILFMGNLVNNSNKTFNIGKADKLFLTGYFYQISDGTTTIIPSNIVSLNTEQTISALKKYSVIPQTNEGRTYTNDRDITDKGYVDGEIDNVYTALETHENDNTNPHQVSKSQVGLGNLTNDLQVKASEKGVANGVATLDQNGKLLITQIPDSIVGQLKFGGVITYRSSAPNNPIVNLSSIGVAVLEATTSAITWENLKPKIKSAGAKAVGLYFIAVNYSDYDFEYDTDKEIENINTGDWLIIYQVSSEMFSLQKIDNTDAVASVNGKIGVVVLDKTDIGLGNVNNTSDLDKPVSSAQQQALDSKIDILDAQDIFQSKVISVDITVMESDWDENNTFISDNVFNRLGFVSSDDLYIWNCNNDTEFETLANTYKAFPYNVASPSENETYVYFKCAEKPTDAITYRINLIKKNVVYGDMTGYLNVGDLDNETIEYRNGKVRVIGGGDVSSVNEKTGAVVLNASDIKATNTQTIQQNLERIDTLIESKLLHKHTIYAVDEDEGTEYNLTIISPIATELNTIALLESAYNNGKIISAHGTYEKDGTTEIVLSCFVYTMGGIDLLGTACVVPSTNTMACRVLTGEITDSVEVL